MAAARSPSTPSSNVLILDGGLGTTLEDVFHRNISTPLWSAKPVDEEPEVIIAVHLAFLDAGADIVLTSTYQCAFNTFDRAGYARADAERIMLESVRLALEARRRFLARGSGNNGARTPPRVAISLGPYGATLYPAQEFDGFYPPPYGPGARDGADKTNAFPLDTDAGRAQEAAAVDALAAFHLERLVVFAGDAEVWGAVDYLAFETVPLVREVRAIRRAVARLYEMKPGLAAKPWWISTVHPDGHSPEKRADARGGWVTATEVAESVLLGDDEDEATPWAFGVNCTALESLPHILKDAGGVAKRFAELHGRQPWLVMHPNRGDVYIPETQSWKGTSREGTPWAKDVGDIGRVALQSGCWEGIVVGGCCKTGPDEIAGLKQHRFIL
ncbi:Homocysteine S-methyltransferase [Epithele typhae]|uniref:Homocysteine S-methyltransferase n=1 Tax=Epithele typhae TaxID=378194 RepID=UPI0020085A23|nr:Homocysteine S-methyltransferase [Epithele typhae]KAH9940386.1 Homocysteine S-methyltransferase [Epithele typhae]